MLNVIQKDGAAALGLAARKDEPVTLGGLLELSKYYGQHKKKAAVFDRAVDDAYGYLDRVARPAESIRELLRTGMAVPQTPADLAADNFITAAAPENLKTMLNDLDNGQDTVLEDIPEPTPAWAGYDAEAPDIVREAVRRQNVPETPSMPVETAVLQQMQAFISAPPARVAYLHSRNIPATAGGLKALDKLSRRSTALAEALEALDGETAEEIRDILPRADLEALREGVPPERIYAEMTARLDEAGERAETKDQLESAEAAKQLAGLRQALNRPTNFQLPITVNGRIKNLNVYMINENASLADGTRVLVSLDTQTLGTVRASLTLTPDKAEITINTDSHEAYEKLAGQHGILEAFVREAGFAEAEIRFGIEERLTSDTTFGNASIPHAPDSTYDLGEYEFIV
jgi:hypothetical protein